MSKRIFITGGAKGIGKAIVQAFSKENNQVAFCDIDVDAGKILSESTHSSFFKADAGNKEELESALQKLFADWGDIDIVINNVGVGHFKPITELSVEEFEKVLDINLRSVFITSRLLALHRSEMEPLPRYGRIVNIASTRYLMSEPGTEGYAASKGGIVSLTHALTVSLSKYHITVNCISPGWIETKDYDSLTVADHEQHLSGRVGTPQDIARACLFLCDPDNNFINGQNVVIDGGMTKKMIYV